MKRNKPTHEPGLAEQLKRVIKEMRDAEDALVASGFSREQWLLIKKYVGSAIVQNQILALHSLSSFNPENEL